MRSTWRVADTSTYCGSTEVSLKSEVTGDLRFHITAVCCSNVVYLFAISEYQVLRLLKPLCDRISVIRVQKSTRG